MSEPINAAKLASILIDVVDELERARKNNAPFNSEHEGYAVLLEEVDELWDEVKLNPKARSNTRTQAEAIQVAAMALRFIYDLTYDKYQEDVTK